jgi:quercetin 2,3-dioxygenase
MIKHIKSDSRYTADHGWLKSRFSFSFADYYDPSNMNFGHLRVFNDDIVQPGGGFGSHPHRDMEIVTYVIEGALEHQDSMGNKGILQAGEVQRMTAGSGVMHSEYNASDKESVHFLQIWIKPREHGLTPSWEQKPYNVHESPNSWVPVVSGGSIPETLHINQDAIFQAANIETGHVLDYKIPEGHLAHLFVIDGAVELNTGYNLASGDTARITETELLTLKATEKAHVLLIELSA